MDLRILSYDGDTTLNDGSTFEAWFEPGTVRLAWEARAQEEREAELWYVVHWYDHEDDVWRGVAWARDPGSMKA